MKKIALIGDIHGNLPALEAVLGHAESLSIDQIWNIGDSVGYGAFPNEVVEYLQQSSILSILGNYDEKVLKFPKKNKKWSQSKKHEKWLAFKFAFEQLSPISYNYLKGLPKDRRFDIEGWRVLLTHGSPFSPDEHLLPTTSEERLRFLTHLTDADLIICGHSHQPFARFVNHTWFINTGSVGRPDDGDPRASYALLEIESGQIKTTHFRIPYDLQRAVNAIHQHNLPEEFAVMAIQGRNLDAVLKQKEIVKVITSSGSTKDQNSLI